MEIIREFQKFKKLISDVRNHISQSNINRFVRRIIWNNYVYRDINISQDDKISDNYNWFVDKLIPLTEKWNLVNNSIEFFTVDNHMHSNFGRVMLDVDLDFLM
jgi:hypothetical protein